MYQPKSLLSSPQKIFDEQHWLPLFCNLNFPKNFTCPLGKLRTGFTSPIAKSTTPGYGTRLSLHAVCMKKSCGQSICLILFSSWYSGRSCKRHPWDTKRVSITGAHHSQKCKTTKFVCQLRKMGFCEGGCKYMYSCSLTSVHLRASNVWGDIYYGNH